MSMELPENISDSNLLDIRLNLEMELESSNETSNRKSRLTQKKARYCTLNRILYGFYTAVYISFVRSR